MASLSDVAQALGISKASVSNALNGKGRMKAQTRETILRTAAEMGVIPRVSPKKELRRIIIVQETTESYTGFVTDGILESAIAAGVSLPVYDLGLFVRKLERSADTEQLRPLLMDLLNEIPTLPSGILYVSQYPRRAEGLLSHLGIPVVSVRMMDSGENYAVDCDNEQGAYAAVSYLYGIGRTRIATISGLIDTYSSSERMIGYQRALIDHGLTYQPRWIWTGDWVEETGYQFMKKMLTGSHVPDALFAQNDRIAFGALQAAKDAGVSVPDELAIIGFNGDEFCGFTDPPITTVRPDYSLLGRIAFEKMSALLNGETLIEKRIFLPCVFKKGGTA